jgi:hypothetical protein
MKKVKLPDLFDIDHSKSFQSPLESCTEPKGTGKSRECVYSAGKHAMYESLANTSCESARNKPESTAKINSGINDTSQETLYSIPNSAHVQSDDFRINESSETTKSEGTRTDFKLTERKDQSIMHFKSGLSLPISTKSQSSMKVIANASKCDDNSSMTYTPCRTSISSNNEADDETNEVHKHVKFDALKILRPDSFERQRKESSHVISNSKHSAAQAMMASSSLVASRRLVSNIRLVYQAASNFSHNDGTLNEKSGPILYDSDDVIVTFDPTYLSEQSGMLFLDDMECIIRSELLKSSNDSSFIFLDNEIQRSDDKAMAVPTLLKPFVESSNTEISLLLILAATVEDSIRISRGSSSKTGLQGNYEFAKDDISQPRLQCFRSQRHDIYYSLLSDVFSSYMYLEGKDMLRSTISLPSMHIDSIRIQDLLFVPLDKITVVSASEIDPAMCTTGKVGQLIAKWNHVINYSCQLDFTQGDSSISATDQEVVELFADDILKNKPTHSKKKKKNKKVCLCLIFS